MKLEQWEKEYSNLAVINSRHHKFEELAKDIIDNFKESYNFADVNVLLEKLADVHGSREAMLYLIKIYDTVGCSQNYKEKGITYLQQLAQYGFGEAALKLAYQYEGKGNLVSINDFELAHKWYAMASRRDKSGDTKVASKYMAEHYRKGRKPSECTEEEIDSIQTYYKDGGFMSDWAKFHTSDGSFENLSIVEVKSLINLLTGWVGNREPLNELKRRYPEAFNVSSSWWSEINFPAVIGGFFGIMLMGFAAYPLLVLTMGTAAIIVGLIIALCGLVLIKTTIAKIIRFNSKD